ncbi:MAG: MoaD/ThiS family protein [Planctomycetota bacterium]
MTASASEPTTATQQVEILLFGPQARHVGADRVTVSLPERPTVRDAFAALGKIEALRPSLASSRLAVDHEYAAPDDRLKTGAELALIGLVSGG